MSWVVHGSQSEAGGLPQAGSKPGGYVPPSRRAGATMSDGDSMRRREENSVRVTNLSEDTREDDLRVSTYTNSDAAHFQPCFSDASILYDLGSARKCRISPGSPRLPDRC